MTDLTPDFRRAMMASMKIIQAKCPACAEPLDVRVGMKLTVRTVTCACGAKFEYSCWVRTSTPAYDVHQIDLFPARVDRRSWTDTVRA